MCPFAVDEDRMSGKVGDQPMLSLDPLKPPVKEIPKLEFPKVVYKHPREPFRVIEHRNAKHELVEEEHVPTEHLTQSVADAVALEQALSEGWVLKPYIAPALPDKNAHLYDAPSEATKASRAKDAK